MYIIACNQIKGLWWSGPSFPLREKAYVQKIQMYKKIVLAYCVAPLLSSVRVYLKNLLPNNQRFKLF